ADLMREAAGPDHRDLDLVGEALDRFSQRAPEREATPRGWDRKLEHADLQRHERGGPPAFVRHHHRQRREDAVIEAALLKVRQIEAVRDEAVCDVLREGRMAPE